MSKRQFKAMTWIKQEKRAFSQTTPTHPTPPKKQAWQKTTTRQKMHEEYAKKNFFGYQIVVNIPYTWVERWWDKITKPSWCSEVWGNFLRLQRSWWRLYDPYVKLDDSISLHSDATICRPWTHARDIARWPLTAHTPSSPLPSLRPLPPCDQMRRSSWDPTLCTHSERLSFFCWSVAFCACELYSLLQSNASSSVELSCAFIDILWCSSRAQWNSMDITYNSHKGIAIVIHFALWLFLCFDINSLVSLDLHKLSEP